TKQFKKLSDNKNCNRVNESMEDGNVLIVGREIGQSVIIDHIIKVTLLQVGSKLRLVIDAPNDIRISKENVNSINKNLKKGVRVVEDSTLIGENIKISILQTDSGLLRFAIDAPKEVSIFREELFERNVWHGNQKIKII
ncbi:carbon storage regulator, partial [Neobacillus drentensis]|uniref:carbon storage regulator n=1 Tax=Neobacillus drentensis TaxID=220684 RepID=UPI002FFD7B1C